MRALLSTMLWLFLASVGYSQSDTDVEKREAKLYETIGELIDRRDETLKKFAVVMQGEGTAILAGRPPVLYLLFDCRVADASRQFDLYCSFVILQGDDTEDGDELVRIGDQWKGRNSGSLMARKYQKKPPGSKLSTWQEKFNQAYGFDPYDDFMLGANGLNSRSSRGVIENLFLKRLKLLKTESSLGDRLIASWSLPYYNQYTITKTVEFDPAYEMMPVRVSDRVEGRPNDFHEMKLTWSRHGKQLLPSRISTAVGDVNDEISRTERTYKLHWAIGDEVPDSIFESEDHLAALFDHFKLPHCVVVNGDIIRPHYEAPADLYDETAKK